MELLELNSTSLIISWVVTVFLGGVVYKYIDRFMKFRNEKKSTDLDTSKMLIESMMSQMKNLTDRISKLENEREEYHKREIQVTAQFTAATIRVAELEKTVEKLEVNQEALKKHLDSYKQKYGKLDT